jgi:hypothetical protein
MSKKPDFWDQACYARPENSWAALAVNLACWTALYTADLVGVVFMHFGNVYAVAGVVLFLIPLGHGGSAVLRKLRGR